jgi:hypothetical protein
VWATASSVHRPPTYFLRIERVLTPLETYLQRLVALQTAGPLPRQGDERTRFLYERLAELLGAIII